jgi:GNAT superfamily N-acetyltransferase
MTFILNEIKRNDFIKGLSNIGPDKKWFLYIVKLKNLNFFNISYQIEGNIQIIGMGNIYKLNQKNDYSFFIFPQYRRKGFGKKFITELIQINNNIQFTVSEYNKESLSMLQSIDELKIQMKTTETPIIIFEKG